MIYYFVPEKIHTPPSPTDKISAVWRGKCIRTIPKGCRGVNFQCMDPFSENVTSFF
jgi:hypothetical protein